ncbi:unnamed protein product [Sphacelaria rigidula]
MAETLYGRDDLWANNWKPPREEVYLRIAGRSYRPTVRLHESKRDHDCQSKSGSRGCNSNSSTITATTTTTEKYEEQKDKR